MAHVPLNKILDHIKFNMDNGFYPDRIILKYSINNNTLSIVHHYYKYYFYYILLGLTVEDK